MAISRREFLKASAGATTVATLASPVAALTPKRVKFDPSPLNKWPGRCVLNYNNQHEATSNGGSDDDLVVIQKMMDDAIMLLVQEPTVGECWKAIFPDTLSQSTKIAIKVNILNSDIPSHPLVVKGIVEGLMQMEIEGENFPASNIYLYDANNNTSFNRAGFSSSLFSDVNLVKDSLSDHGDGALGKKYADTLNECDFLINIPSIRGHSSCERFTLGFKSHYGTYPASYHDSTNSRGYLRDIVGTGPIYDKHVLTIVSALFGLKEGSGPSGSWGSNFYYTKYVETIDPDSDDPRPNTIVITTDPITAEFQAVKIMRMGHGGGWDVDDMPKYLQASGGIEGSLDTVLNFGIIDESEMIYGEIINEEITVNIDPTDVVNKETSLLKNNIKLMVYSGLSNKSIFIDFTVPSYYTGEKAEITIVNIRGRRVRRLSQKLLGIRTRAVWDCKDTSGRHVAAGKYIVKARIGNMNLVNSVSIVR